MYEIVSVFFVGGNLIFGLYICDNYGVVGRMGNGDIVNGDGYFGLMFDDFDFGGLVEYDCFSGEY